MPIWTVLYNALPVLKQGAINTLILWATASSISLTFGLAAGIVRAKRTRVPVISLLTDAVTFLLRGIPFYVQLLIAYFVFPHALGINLSAFFAGALSLGLCSAAYVSQMIRGTMNSISEGQWEAATSLGYTRIQTLRHVIMPQVLTTLIPSLTSELDQLLKSTAIISSIGVLELTLTARNLVAKYLEPMAIYCAIAVIYLLFSTIILGISTLIERKFAYDRR